MNRFLGGALFGTTLSIVIAVVSGSVAAVGLVFSPREFLGMMLLLSVVFGLWSVWMGSK